MTNLMPISEWLPSFNNEGQEFIADQIATFFMDHEEIHKELIAVRGRYNSLTKEDLVNWVEHEGNLYKTASDMSWFIIHPNSYLWTNGHWSERYNATVGPLRTKWSKSVGDLTLLGCMEITRDWPEAQLIMTKMGNANRLYSMNKATFYSPLFLLCAYLTGSQSQNFMHNHFRSWLISKGYDVNFHPYNVNEIHDFLYGAE
jgi:hypothetical protein